MRQRRPVRNRLFPLMTGLWLASPALAHPGDGRERPDAIEVSPHEEAWELSWSDTEERLQGSLRPVPPREGQPLHVSLDVGSFEGAPFTGPLILTLRPAGATHGQSVTVKRGERHWEATFVPQTTGPHVLDVGFRTTRTKALHAPLEVSDAPVSRAVGWGLLGVGLLALLGYTVRGMLKTERSEPPVQPSPGTDAGEAPPPQIHAAPEPPAPNDP
ncbi:hypothetical protein [Cystobacter ferrugineus]|nr:hypothetical protein [Cystobacter ferrugineus]